MTLTVEMIAKRMVFNAVNQILDNANDAPYQYFEATDGEWNDRIIMDEICGYIEWLIEDEEEFIVSFECFDIDGVEVKADHKEFGKQAKIFIAMKKQIEGDIYECIDLVDGEWRAVAGY